MALPRNQEAAQIQTRSVGEVQHGGSQRNLAGRYDAVQVDTSGLEALSNILEVSKRMAGKRAEQKMDMAYMEGARAAWRGEAVESLEGNILTKPFLTTGHADTYASIDQTARYTDLQARMPHLRTLGIDDFQKEVKKATEGLEKNHKGMSTSARLALAKSQMETEGALTKTYTAENAKYIIEQRADALNASGLAIVGSINAANHTDDIDAYGTAISSTAGWLDTLKADETLPTEIKSKMAVDMAKLLASEGHTFPLQSLTAVGAFDHLSMEDRGEVNRITKNSRDATLAEDNGAYIEHLGQLEALISNNEYVPESVLRDSLEEGVQRGLVSAAKVQSTWKAYYNSVGTARNMDAAIAGVRSGNPTMVLNAGSNIGQASKAMFKDTLEKHDLPTAIAESLNVARLHGIKEPLREAMQYLTPPISAIGNGAELSQDNAQIISAVLDTMAHDTQDNPIRTQIASELPEELREKLLSIDAFTREGLDVQQAVTKYTENQRTLAGMSPERRTAMAKAQQTAVDAEIDKMHDPNGAGAVWDTLMYPFSASAKESFRRRIDAGEATNADLLLYQQSVSGISEAADSIRRRYPLMSPKNVIDMATAELSSRAVMIDAQKWNEKGTVTYLPKGVNIESLVGQQADRSTISSTVSRLIEDRPKGADSTAVSYVDGVFQVEHWNKEGILLNEGYQEISIEDIRESIKQSRQELEDKNKERFTWNNPETYISQIDGSTQTLQISGLNGAGVDEGTMYAARKALLHFEGVRDKPYPDGGKNSFGVAINDPNYKHYPKNGSPEEIQRSFIAYTEDQAKHIVRTVAPTLGWDNLTDDQTLFLMDFGYQAGDHWATSKRVNPTYKQLAAAIKDRDYDKAVAAMANTPAYSQSQPERQRYRQKLLTRIFHNL